jgi:type I restriction enzyme S subunit
MSAYRPYPKYKDSGVEWLGDVPEGWEVRPLKFAAALRTQKSEGRRNAIGLENIESWSGRFIETASEFDGEGIAVEAGDILFGKLRPYLAKALLVTEPSDAVGDFHAMRPNRQTHAPFLLYQILSKDFITMVDGSTFGSKMPRASWEFVGKMPIPLPHLPEQIQIAAFLDRECGKLDTLQAKQERLIELLKEKRQALISHAVTKGLPGVASAKTGLDPTAKLKPSGIERLGDVPEGWEVKKLGLVGTFKGGAGFPDDYQGETENEIPFLKAGDIVNSDSNGVMRLANHTITRETAKQLRAFIFPCVTVVFAKVGAALLLKRFRTLGQPSCLDNNMMGMTAGKRTLPGFLIYVLPLLDFELIVNPGAVPSINEGQISSQRIALPPLAEQRAIVAHLDEKCGKIDQLKAKAERAIALLKERRGALISAAVTGKIDVRDVAEESICQLQPSKTRHGG